MEHIHKLKILDFITINNIKYQIINIKVKKNGKCFQDHYGSNFIIDLLDDNNENLTIIFNEKNINNYDIKNINNS